MSDEHEKLPPQDTARDMWLLTPLGSIGRTTIEVERYEELRALAVKLAHRAHAAKAEGVREERARAAKAEREIERSQVERATDEEASPEDRAMASYAIGIICALRLARGEDVPGVVRGEPVASAPAASAEVCPRCKGDRFVMPLGADPKSAAWDWQPCPDCTSRRST